MTDCCSSLNICLGSLGVAVAALAWCAKMEFQIKKKERDMIVKKEMFDLNNPPSAR